MRKIKSEDYVIKHQYGYGGENKDKIKKLKLRNVNDLKIYIGDVVDNAFCAYYEDNVIFFTSDNSSCKINVEIL